MSVDEQGRGENPIISASADTGGFGFYGSYAHALDNKGRMIIPNAYRAALGETFAVGPTRDFQGIALYPNAVFRQVVSDIQSMNQRNPKVQLLNRQFTKLSYPEAQADGQGRLLLPAKLRQRMLGEAKELEISGAFDHIRVVDNASAEAEDQYFAEHREELLEQLAGLDD